MKNSVKYFVALSFAITMSALVGMASPILSSVVDGVLDLRSKTFEEESRVSLKGDWLFFSDTLIQPEAINDALNSLPYKRISVPTKRKAIEGTDFGTYYFSLSTDSIPYLLSLNSLTVYSAANFFIDGRLVANIGKPASTKGLSVPGLVLRDSAFYLGAGEHQVVVQFSNYYREKIGLANDVYLETKKSKVKRSVIQLIKNGIILGTILFIIVNQINFYFIRRKNVSAFYFGLASIFIFGYIIFMSLYYFGDIAPSFNPDFQLTLRVWRVIYYSTVCFFVLYIGSLFEAIFSTWVKKIAVVYCLLSALITLVLPLYISSINFNFFMYFTLLICLYAVGVGIVGIIRRVEFSALFIAGFAFFVATVTNDILHNLLIINSVNLLELGIFGMMMTQAQIINMKLHRYLSHSEDLSSHLSYVNNNLETLVTERTEEIEMQKAEIEAQRDEIIEQRDYALNQHKIISTQKKTITDSINYAKEIQDAVLPDEESLNKYFAESFILFKPKDFVSGDFYWMREYYVDGKKYFAFCVADCTGHGVPGALLSMLGMSLLSEIVLHQQVCSASDILEELRDRFKDILDDHLKKPSSSDGMHISACVLSEDGFLDCAGAFQSFYHFRGGKGERYKGTRSIIGIYMHEVPFVSTQIQLEKGDRLYFYTDGYADQMSGRGQGRIMQRSMLKMFKSFEEIPLHQQKGKLEDYFEQWRGLSEQIDDVLVVGLKF